MTSHYSEHQISRYRRPRRRTIAELSRTSGWFGGGIGLAGRKDSSSAGGSFFNQSRENWSAAATYERATKLTRSKRIDPSGARFKDPPDYLDRVGKLLLDALQRRLREKAERTNLIAPDIHADCAHPPWLRTTLPKCAPLIWCR
jgi:hypothetical protein